MVFRNHFLAALLAFVFVLLPAFAQAQKKPKEWNRDGITVIHVESPVRDWLVDRPSGRLFAATPAENQIVELDTDGEEVRTFALPAAPTEMIIKSDKLCVCIGKALTDRRRDETDSPALVVIDLNSNKIDGKVDIPVGAIGGLFCSRVDNNFVGLINHRVGDFHKAENQLLQIDIAELAVRNAVPVENWPRNDFVQFAMSENGKWAVEDQGTLMRVDEEEFTFVQKARSSGSGLMTAGPANRFWLFGSHLFDTIPTSNKSEIQFAGKKAGRIHHRLDLVATSDGESMYIDGISAAIKNGKRKHGSELKKIRIKSWGNPSKAWEFASRSRPRIFFDDDGNAFHCDERTCHIISLAEVGIEASDLFLLNVPAQVELVTGQTVDLELAVHNGEIDTTTFASTQMPDGAELVGNRLKWTPTADQIGSFEFRVEAQSENGARDAVAIAVEVRTLSIPLDIVAHGIQTSPDGKFAAVWGREQGGNQPDKMQDNEPWKMQIVNLKDLSVVSSATLPSAFSGITIVDQKVFVVMKPSLFRIRQLVAAETGSSAEDAQWRFLPETMRDVLVFDRDTMKPLEPIRVTGIPESVHALQNKKVVVRSGVNTGSDSPIATEFESGFYVAIYDAETSDIITEDKWGGYDTFFAIRDDSQLECAGRIYSLTDGKVISLSRKPAYEPLLSNPNQHPSEMQIDSGPQGVFRKQAFDNMYPFKFGRQLHQYTVQDFAGKRLFELKDSNNIDMGEYKGATILNFLSDSKPLAHSIILKKKRHSEDHAEVCIMQTFRLIDGQEVGEPINLCQRRGVAGTYSKYSASIGGGTIGIAVGSQVFVASAEVNADEEIQSPFFLKYPNKPVLSSSQIERFKIPAIGGTGEIKFALKVLTGDQDFNLQTGQIETGFELKEQTTGVQIDVETGEITVDTPALWNEYVKRSVTLNRPDQEVAPAIEADGQPRVFGKRKPLTPSQVFENMYGYAVGLEPRITYLPIHVLATDSDGQIAESKFYLTVLGNSEAVEAAKGEHQEKMAEKRELENR